MRLSALLALAALAATTALAAGPVGPDFDPDTGYRISRYRAPTPETVAGAERVDAAEVEALVESKSAILIDAMPAEGAGPDPDTGEWRLMKPRDHIPGSVWLPDVGKGVLSPDMDRYFRSNLDRLTRGDKSRKIVIYCLADCWMGWNAVRRAASYGYTSILWFSEGTDGWRDWNGVLEPAHAVPLARP